MGKGNCRGQATPERFADTDIVVIKFNEYKEANKKYGLGSGFMDLQDGENRLRVVSDAEFYKDVFTDKKTGETRENPRFAVWVIDRADGQIKPWTFGPSIFNQIGKIATSSEYGFVGLPPFDFIVDKSGTGMETRYTVVASRKDTVLTKEEQTAVSELKPIVEVVEAVQNKKGVQPAVKAKNRPDYDDIPVYEESTEQGPY